jgi:pimeloyl-ACP methyl ester carboxylesterase
MGILDYQYLFAAKIGDKLKGKKNTTYIGHSLGGGLASLAALRSGGRAMTFNAAGLSGSTMKMFGVEGKSTKKINAYVIYGEVLNFTLMPLGQGAIGNVHYLKPKNAFVGTVQLHGIEEVIKSLGIKQNKK